MQFAKVGRSDALDNLPLEGVVLLMPLAKSEGEVDWYVIAPVDCRKLAAVSKKINVDGEWPDPKVSCVVFNRELELLPGEDAI